MLNAFHDRVILHNMLLWRLFFVINELAIMVNLPYINRNFDISKQMSVVNFSGVLNILKARK